MRPGGNRPIAVIKKVRHFAGMPTHPHLLVVTLIGLLLILRGFRTERVSWVGSSFDRATHPKIFWLTISFGSVLTVLGTYGALRE
jgi:hypothetical protein